MRQVFRPLPITIFLCAAAAARADIIDLTQANVVIRAGELPAAEKIASVILKEEVAKRTGATSVTAWTITDRWPTGSTPVIALSVVTTPPAWKQHLPSSKSDVLKKPEGFSIRAVAKTAGRPARVSITGSDPRGLMFGVGKLLRTLDWGPGPVTLEAGFRADLAPDRPIRGHQIGYRAKANSWDAWTIEQFEQYFRDLAIFGANAVENIPFEDKSGPLMKYGREEMNVKYSQLCAKYDLDYWAWVPVLFPLPNPAKEAAFLKQQEQFYRACPRLDAIFIPGGDPGDNHARDLFPFAEQMAAVLRRFHPRAKIWISLQGFRTKDVDDFYAYLDEHKPVWFGGIVAGPSSPPIEATRRRLALRYRLRNYPDVSHIIRCQYPVPWLDVAWSLTLGREPVNPRPADYAAIYREDYRFTDGFITYSDGIADDFNKNLWTQLGWEPNRPIRDMALEYARFFFRPDVAERGADGLLALETNLRCSLPLNGSVDANLLLWQEIEKQFGGVTANWRFDMHLFRAYYDGYTRQRLLYETELERLALAKLAEAPTLGVAPALDTARRILNRATTHPQRKELLARIESLADRLYERIGYQTSVPKYHGSRDDRGCVMDFVNYPLNNRWWLEDQFDRIARLPDQASQLKRIDVVRNWDNPGAGGFYDVVGDVGRSPRMAKVYDAVDATRLQRDLPMPTHRPTGRFREPLRIAWHVYQDDVPRGLTYRGLDPRASYTVKLFAQRTSPLLIDGQPGRLLRKGETYDQVTEQEFEVPQTAVQDGQIVLSWARLDQRNLNWRQHHYVTDVWVIRHAGKTPVSSRD